jgi:uncharacterized protein with von Willebrand factor type A (vWA) domain
MPDSILGDDYGGRFAANVMHFARTLRAAGLPVGPGKTLDAVRAVHTVGIAKRADFYWTLHAVFVNRRDQREVFDQAFHVFWRNPALLQRMMGLILPTIRPEEGLEKDQLNRRVAEALRGNRPDAGEDGEESQEIKLDAALTWSDREILHAKDFDKMSGEEMRRAKAAIATLRLPIMEVPTRRFRADPAGARIDMRATMRNSLRSGGDLALLRRRSRRRRHPPLVALCDISGSMDRYSRLLLHFLHAITNDRDRVSTFLFGTHLTNVSRHLRRKDVDVALDKVAEAVTDWSGGTRIGQCLHAFNRQWSRRVLGQGAVVLLISDGLDRDHGSGLDREMERLHKSCRRLIWLNPMLRFDGYEPRALGNRAIMPHVDDLRAVHNLNSLQALAQVLGEPAANAADMARWRRAAAA